MDGKHSSKSIIRLAGLIYEVLLYGNYFFCFSTSVFHRRRFSGWSYRRLNPVDARVHKCELSSAAESSSAASTMRRDAGGVFKQSQMRSVKFYDSRTIWPEVDAETEVAARKESSSELKQNLSMIRRDTEQQREVGAAHAPTLAFSHSQKNGRHRRKKNDKQSHSL